MSVEEKIQEQHTNTRVKIDQLNHCIRRPRNRNQRRRETRNADRGSDDDAGSSDDDDGLIHAGRLYSPKQVALLEGCCLARVYQRLAAGEYAAFKDGRSTRIPGSSILDRREKKLKAASFKAPQPQPSRFHTIKTA
jgi:hypothetical protein